MDYYTRRSRVFNEIKEYLARRDELLSKNLKAPEFKQLQNRLTAEYGVTKKMVKQFIEQLIPHGTVKDDEIVRREDGK